MEKKDLKTGNYYKVSGEGDEIFKLIDLETRENSVYLEGCGWENISKLEKPSFKFLNRKKEELESELKKVHEALLQPMKEIIKKLE